MLAGSFVARRRELEPAREHRVDGDAIAIELEDDELAAPAHAARSVWPTSAASSAGVPRTASGAGASRPYDRPAGERSVEGVRDDRQIGQLGHGRAIVAACSGVLDSAGPSGRNCTRPRSSRCDHEGADRGPPSDGPLDRRTHGLGDALGPFRFEGARRQETELTEEQQGGTMPPAEASAEAPTSEQPVGAVAVADEPATSPSLETEAMGSEAAMRHHDEPAPERRRTRRDERPRRPWPPSRRPAEAPAAEASRPPSRRCRRCRALPTPQSPRPRSGRRRATPRRGGDRRGRR